MLKKEQLRKLFILNLEFCQIKRGEKNLYQYIDQNLELNLHKYKKHKQVICM